MYSIQLQAPPPQTVNTPSVAAKLSNAASPTAANSPLAQSKITPPERSVSQPETSRPEKTQLETTQPETSRLETSRLDLSKTQQAASIFQQVFGKARNANRVLVPWWVNDRLQGNILINLESDDNSNIYITASDFLAASESLLRAEIQTKLIDRVDSKGFLSSEILRQQGLEVIFDSRRLELRIQIPPTYRKTQISSLDKSAASKELAETIAPSTVSGYLNLRASEKVDWLGDTKTKPGRQPLQAGFEGAINLVGWVLEGDAQFSEGKPLQRGNIRLTHDNTRSALRYVIGDFSPPTTGYQSGSSLLGVAVARNYSLQPDRITRPINQFQFFLERTSRVEIFSNGRSLQSLTLNPGTQDLRDLPLGAGVNDVQLVITDDLGQVKRLDFATAVSSNLLAPGLQQFAYSIGIPSKQQEGSFIYNWQQPTLNLAYRWGVNTSFTTGNYLQANLTTQLLGWENYLATPIGVWNWDVAVSRHQDVGMDVAARLRYDYTKIGDNNPTQRTFGFSAEYRGAAFMSLGDTEPKNPSWLDLNAYYNQKLFRSVNANLNLRYQLDRGGSNSYQIAAGITKDFKSGLSLGAKFTHKQQPNGGTDNQFVVNLNWLKSSASQSFQTASTFSNQESTTHRLSWNFNSRHQIEGFKGNVGIDFTEQGSNLDSRLTYTGNRLSLELSHNNKLFTGPNSPSKSETQFNFASAIVFANGHWAFSRPVTNSFALIAPTPSFIGQKVGINSDSKGGYAAVTKRRAAVIPDLSPYQIATLRLDAPDLPIGMDLGESVFKLLPTYKSGTLLNVGKDSNVFLRGHLQDETGTPVEFGAGKILSLSDPNWTPITIFTNKTGRFALPGFKPGKYLIQLAQPKTINIRFEIPERTTGIYSVETLKP